MFQVIEEGFQVQFMDNRHFLQSAEAGQKTTHTASPMPDKNVAGIRQYVENSLHSGGLGEHPSIRHTRRILLHYVCVFALAQIKKQAPCAPVQNFSQRLIFPDLLPC
jgi:hypothetical protein